MFTTKGSGVTSRVPIDPSRLRTMSDDLAGQSYGQPNTRQASSGFVSEQLEAQQHASPFASSQDEVAQPMPVQEAYQPILAPQPTFAPQPQSRPMNNFDVQSVPTPAPAHTPSEYHQTTFEVAQPQVAPTNESFESNAFQQSDSPFAQGGYDAPVPNTPAPDEANEELFPGQFGRRMPEESMPGSPVNIKMLLFSIAGGVLVVVFAVGGYMWSQRGDGAMISQVDLQAPLSSQTTPPVVAEPEPPKEVLFDFRVNTQNLAIYDVTKENSFSSFMSRVNRSAESLNTGDLVEVMIQEEGKTTPMLASDFFAKMNIELDASILSQLDGEVRYFLYRGVDAPKSAVVMHAKDRAVLQDKLKTQETLLITQLKSLLIRPASPTATTTFQNSSYRGYAIRFVNLDTLNAQSIDYTFRRDALVIATSKETTRAILDYLDK